MSARRPWFTLAAVFVVFALGGAATVSAQPSRGRFEVGAAVTALRLSSFDATSAGIAGRFTVNATDWLAADAELAFTPHDDVVLAAPGFDFRTSYFRRRIEAFAGPKVGVRNDSVGVFARIRPGVTQLTDRGIGCTGEVCALALLARPDYRPEFALDLGGGVEFFPFGRAVARIDVGDTIIRHRSAAPPCRDCSTHNFASRFGVGLRF